MRKIIASLFLLLAALLLNVCARALPGFADAYSEAVYPLLAGSVGRFSSLFSFSLSEIGLYAALVWLLSQAVRIVRAAPGRRPGRTAPVRRFGARLLLLASCLLFLYTAACGVNYYRRPFSQEAGLTPRPSTPQELYRLCERLVEEINALAPEAAGKAAPDRRELLQMAREGQAAMTALGERFPQLSGWYPRPKPLLNPRLLSVLQLCGIYSPFTVEANFNGEMPRYNIPHTICHELSHLKSYMREDEAGFIGYLACIGSESADFRYSGYLTGWVYAGNALAEADLAAYYRLAERLDPRAYGDLLANNAFWQRFDGKVSEASARVNDRYLRSNNQADGIRSYGRLVDLMIAYYDGD